MLHDVIFFQNIWHVSKSCVHSTFRYEVKFQEGQECGGAYVKLLTEESKPELVSLGDGQKQLQFHKMCQ